MKARAQQALADLYVKKGDDAAAGTFERSEGKNATSTAALGRWRARSKRGDNAKALDHFMTAALGGQPKADDEIDEGAVREGAQRQLGWSHEALDKAYLDKFPNPVKAEDMLPAARAKAARAPQLFTGSGCPPCVV